MKDKAREWWMKWMERIVTAKGDQDEGLTLIEMLAVVVILGIVAAIAIPAVTSAINQSKVNATESDMGTLQSALSRYYMDVGTYPPDLTDLTTQPSGVNNWNGPYIRENWPMYDAWAHKIYYAPLSSDTAADAGYLLLSGDGTRLNVSTGSLTLSSGAKVIYAAGGTDGTDYIGSAPAQGTGTTLLGPSANNLTLNTAIADTPPPPSTGSAVSFVYN